MLGHSQGQQAIANNMVASLDTAGQEPLNQTMTRAVNRLTNEHGFELKQAQMCAAKAVAEHDSKNIDAHIDLKNSTKSCVFIVMDGQTRVISLSELMTFLHFQ